MNPLESPRNIFLTGQAGTGKTYIINDYLSCHPDTLVCASTGSAAVDISGTTVHRLFSIPAAICSNPFQVPDSKLKVFQNTPTIIIDEISMCRADIFSYVVQLLKRAEKLYGHKIRLIVSGDFFQLPPVVKKEEEAVLRKHGYNPSGFAFTTPEWQSMRFKTVELKDIYRQDNAEFIEELGRIRVGDTSDLNYFDQFIDAKANDGIILCGTNTEADKVNQEYLENHDGETKAYFAHVQGRWADLPCEETLVLKKRLRVICTANDVLTDAEHPVGRFQNGTQGVIEELGNGYIDIRTIKGERIRITPYTWYSYTYKTKRGSTLVEKEKTGTVTQFPLRIAKAITIHKSQGKTFDKAVISPKSFAAGQLYVALSRIKSPDGLILTEPLQPEYVLVDKAVKKFYENGFSFSVSEAVKKKRADIIRKQKEAAKPKKKVKRTKKSSGAAKKKAGTAGKKAGTKETKKRRTGSSKLGKEKNGKVRK